MNHEPYQTSRFERRRRIESADPLITDYLATIRGVSALVRADLRLDRTDIAPGAVEFPAAFGLLADALQGRDDDAQVVAEVRAILAALVKVLDEYSPLRGLDAAVPVLVAYRLMDARPGGRNG